MHIKMVINDGPNSDVYDEAALDHLHFRKKGINYLVVVLIIYA